MAESSRLRSGLEHVARIETWLATSLAMGLATGLMVQFDYSALYRLVSSENHRNEGLSKASKKGRILKTRVSRLSKGIGWKKTVNDECSGSMLRCGIMGDGKGSLPI